MAYPSSDRTMSLAAERQDVVISLTTAGRDKRLKDSTFELSK